ncbi:MAG: STAS domain-containing protein [Mycobacterium sp.]|nr:STAS domain-containing protein [Mycobacterium sp.]
MDSRSSATAPASCGISEEWTGRTLVISVSGTLDMMTSPRLAEAIATGFLKNPSAMIIDLSDVDFLASAGMGVLVAASDRADGKFKFVVVADGPATSRPLTLVGLADVLGLQPSVERARLVIGA